MSTKDRELNARINALKGSHAEMTDQALQKRLNRLKESNTKPISDEELNQRIAALNSHNKPQSNLQNKRLDSQVRQQPINPESYRLYAQVRDELKLENQAKYMAKQKRDVELNNEKDPQIKNLINLRNKLHDHLDKRILSPAQEKNERKNIENQFLQAKLTLLQKQALPVNKTQKAPQAAVTTKTRSSADARQTAAQKRLCTTQTQLGRAQTSLARTIKYVTSTIEGATTLKSQLPLLTRFKR